MENKLDLLLDRALELISEMRDDEADAEELEWIDDEVADIKAARAKIRSKK
jgi:hypothetical protein